MLDLLVIGAGLSGLSAALAAAEAGMQVRIVAKGMGALHWSAGTLDVLGYLPGNPIAIESPYAAIDALAEDHPYRHVGVHAVRASVDTFQRWMQDAGAAWFGTGEGNLLLPSPAGAVRPTLLAPATQKAGEILPSAAGGMPMLIVGVEGMRDFYPLLIAENLERQGYRARGAFVPWDAASQMRDRNTVQLAEGLEETQQLDALARALKPLTKAGERVGLPAILGMDKRDAVVTALQEMVGAPIFEIPTLPPSVPGIRLYRALAGLLEARGVRIETNMEAIGFQSNQGVIEAVATATSARPLLHFARNFLLATGGILGGGFEGGADGRVREKVFMLPLTSPEGRSHWFRPQFFDAQGQPIFRSGVRVDGRLQPLTQGGDPVYLNLWAAGGALAGSDPIVEHSLEGVALATGITVARHLTH